MKSSTKMCRAGSPKTCGLRSGRESSFDTAGVFHLVVKVCRVPGSDNELNWGSIQIEHEDIRSRASVLRGDVIVRGEGRLRCMFVCDQSEVDSFIIQSGSCPDRLSDTCAAAL